MRSALRCCALAGPDEGLSALQEFERLQAATRARNDAAWQLKLLTDQAREHAARQDYPHRRRPASACRGIRAGGRDRAAGGGRALVNAGDYEAGHSDC